MPISRYYDKDENIIGVQYDQYLDAVVTLAKNHVMVQTIKELRIICDFKFNNEEAIQHLISLQLNALIVAFKGGYIRIYYWPLNPNREEYYEIYLDVHYSITCIMIIPSQQYLMVGFENGVILCLEAREIMEGKVQNWERLNPEWSRVIKLKNYYGIYGVSAMDGTVHIDIEEMKSLDKSIERLSWNIYNEKRQIVKNLENKWKIHKQEIEKLVEDCHIKMHSYKVLEETEEESRKKRLIKLKEELSEVKKIGEKEQINSIKEHRMLMNATREYDKEYEIELKKQKFAMQCELEKLLYDYKNAVEKLKGTQEECIKKARDDIKNLVTEFELVCEQRDNKLRLQEQCHESELNNFR